MCVCVKISMSSLLSVKLTLRVIYANEIMTWGNPDIIVKSIKNMQ